MTENADIDGLYALERSQNLSEEKLVLGDRLLNNPLVTAVHGLREQVSLPPLDENTAVAMIGNHDTKKFVSDCRDVRDVKTSTNPSPSAIDESSGSEISPPFEISLEVSGGKADGANPIGENRHCGRCGGDVTTTSTSSEVSERKIETSPVVTPSVISNKQSNTKNIESNVETSHIESNQFDDLTSGKGAPGEVEYASQIDGENGDHPLEGTLPSDSNGATTFADCANATTSLSIPPSSSFVTLEGMSEDTIVRDARPSVGVAAQEARLPKPCSQSTILDDKPSQDGKAPQDRRASCAGKEFSYPSRHMQAQSEPYGDMDTLNKYHLTTGDVERQRKIDQFHTEPKSGDTDGCPNKDEERRGDQTSPRNVISKKICRAGQKIGGGLSTLRSRGASLARMSSDTSNLTLTMEDIEICQRLDEEYEKALEDREVGWTARYNSVRQSACLSLTFMFVYLILGTMFFQSHTSWDIPDSLLFTIYTITTVGYGNHYLPTEPGFQLFVIFYIFVGIATLTIMVAQVYQCIALEATRAQFSRDRAEMIRRNNERAAVTSNPDANRFHVRARGGSAGSLDFNPQAIHQRSCSEQSFHAIVYAVYATKSFLHYTQVGRGIAFVFPFVGLILLGAIVVGSIEEWTFIESVYFAVVSLTTVGFGDYHPTEKSSIWFCIFWLPFSVGFMSLYLGSVAHFYIGLSNSNIQRMERRMRRRIRRAKEAAEKERQEAYARAMAAAGQHITVDDGGEDHTQEASSSSPQKGRKFRGFATLPTGDSDTRDENESIESNRGAMYGTPEQEEVVSTKRRERIFDNSFMEFKSPGQKMKSTGGQTMSTMRDVLRTVKAQLQRKASVSSSNIGKDSVSSVFVGNDVMGPEIDFTSIRSSKHSRHVGLGHNETHGRKPSFALRVLVQERMAEIIASDIAGYQSNVEIKENTLKITIDSLKTTEDKWLIPHRARKAFRSVAFEALYFVGEHGLIIRGPDALYDLTPFEFHGLFSPFLAAMGDADAMEGWLDHTDVLADVELRREVAKPSGVTGGKNLSVSSRDLSRIESSNDEREFSASAGKSSMEMVKQIDSAAIGHLKNPSKAPLYHSVRRSATDSALRDNLMCSAVPC